HQNAVEEASLRLLFHYVRLYVRGESLRELTTAA
ncbi:MAG: hypothetical protein ACI976_001228, partial [Aureispira sp.]